MLLDRCERCKQPVPEDHRICIDCRQEERMDYECDDDYDDETNE